MTEETAIILKEHYVWEHEGIEQKIEVLRDAILELSSELHDLSKLLAKTNNK